MADKSIQTDSIQVMAMHVAYQLGTSYPAPGTTKDEIIEATTEQVAKAYKVLMAAVQESQSQPRKAKFG